MGVKAKIAATTIGLMAGLTTLAAPASAAPDAEPVQDAPGVQACGWNNGFPPTWDNCSNRTYRIKVTYYNSAGPRPGIGTTLTCVPPGVTNLVDAIDGVGWPTGATGFDNLC